MQVAFLNTFFASEGGRLLCYEIFTVLHNDPSASQDHCGRCSDSNRNLWCITMSHNISQVYVQYIMSSFRKINCKKLRNFCCFYLCQVSGVGTAAQTFQTTYNIYCSLEEINIFYKFAKFSTLAPPTSHMETLGRGFSYRFLQATPEVWVCYNTHILT